MDSNNLNQNGYDSGTNTTYNTGYTTYTAQGVASSPIIEQNHRGRGIIGALLGAIAGGIIWTIIGCLGYVSGWIAALIFLLAQWGYKKLAGKEDSFGIIISVILGLLIIIPATYASYGFSVWQELNEIGNFSYWEVLMDLPMYMNRYDLWGYFLGNLGLGYLFTGIIAISMLFGGRKKK